MPGRRGGKRHGGNGFGGGRGGGYNPLAVGAQRTTVTAEKVDMVTDIFNLAIEKHARYNEEMGCLDCSDLGSMEDIQKHSPNMNNELWCRVVVNCLKKRPACKALYLAKNKIRSLRSFNQYTHGVQLDFLSLESNDLSSIDDIVKLSSLKLKHLMLPDNPIYKGANQDTLLQKIKNGIPTLKRIDTCSLNRTGAVDNIPVASSKLDVQNDSMHKSVADFIAAYYRASQEASGGAGVDSLLDFYDTKAMMSFTCNPHRLALSVTGDGLIFSQSLSQNHHNLQQNVNLSTSMFNGKLNVGKCLEILHRTKTTYDPAPLEASELSLLPAPLVQEARFQLPVVLTCTMHGQLTYVFEDKKKKGGKGGGGGSSSPLAPVVAEYKKYFDRTWVLSMRDSKIVITNDMLHIREAVDSAPTYMPDKHPCYYSVHMCREDNLIVALCAATGLQPKFARKCFEKVGWNAADALAWVTKSVGEGVLTQNLFDDRYKDQNFTSFTLFQDIVRLNDTYCKMLLEMVQFNLWRAWLLFVEKRANLDDSHFLPPMN